MRSLRRFDGVRDGDNFGVNFDWAELVEVWFEVLRSVRVEWIFVVG